MQGVGRDELIRLADSALYWAKEHGKNRVRIPVADWVLHHHERWDGTGYPDGLSGDEIPLGARIIFVADAYDAMTSDRVYRRRLSDEDALGELSACAGTQFDPQIVSAFAEEIGVEPIRLLTLA